MKTYEATYKPDKNKGVYAISLVENPAMEGFFVALSENETIQLKQIDEEQRILIGLVLEPNKPIYRNQNGEEFNIVFSEGTVKELAHGFLKMNNQSNSTIEHSGNKIEGVTFVESWIVENSEIDKSVNFGLSYPKGSWIATMKVDNEDVWQNYIKTGKVQGFSVDAMVGLQEINTKTDIKMSTEKSIAEAITSGFNQFFASFNKKEEEKKIELGEVKTSDGQTNIMFEGDTMQAGGRVWVVAEDGTEVALPAGEYELEGGMVLVVAEDGVIAEVKESMPMQEPQQPAEMTAKEADATAKAIENAIKSIMIKYSDETAKQIEQMKAELKADFDSKLVELASQAAAKPVKGSPQMAEPKTAKERILQTIQNQ